MLKLIYILRSNVFLDVFLGYFSITFKAGAFSACLTTNYQYEDVTLCSGEKLIFGALYFCVQH